MKFKISVYGSGQEFFHIVGNKEEITSALKDYFSDDGDYESCLLASVDDVCLTVKDENENEVFTSSDLSGNIDHTFEDYYHCEDGQYMLVLNYVNQGTWLEVNVEDKKFDIEKFKIGVIKNNSGTFIDTYSYGGEELPDGGTTIPKYENIYVYDSDDNVIDYTEFYDPDDEEENS